MSSVVDLLFRYSIAETVASVAVSFNTGPQDGLEKEGVVKAALISQVAFSFESPPNESTTKDEPCAS